MLIVENNLERSGTADPGRPTLHPLLASSPVPSLTSTSLQPPRYRGVYGGGEEVGELGVAGRDRSGGKGAVWTKGRHGRRRGQAAGGSCARAGGVRRSVRGAERGAGRSLRPHASRLPRIRSQGTREWSVLHHGLDESTPECQLEMVSGLFCISCEFGYCSSENEAIAARHAFQVVQSQLCRGHLMAWYLLLLVSGPD